MNEPTLFDVPADPMWRSGQVTSRSSAGTVDVNARESEIVDVLRLAVTSMTVADIQSELHARGIAPRERANISRRLTSLARKGVAERCGVELKAGGRARTTWRLLP